MAAPTRAYVPLPDYGSAGELQVRNLLSGAGVSFVFCDGSPNGVLVGPRYQVAVDRATGAAYQNTDGATTWAAFAPGGGLTAVAHDNTLAGDGTGGTPLTLAGANGPAQRTALGATVTGSALFTAASAAAALTTLGATAAGSALFTAADAAAQRTALGATAAGTALFTSASASAQRTTLGVGTTQQPTFLGVTLTDGEINVAVAGGLNITGGGIGASGGGTFGAEVTAPTFTSSALGVGALLYAGGMGGTTATVAIVNAELGFYGAATVAQQTGVAVTAGAIHAALVNLGLITA